MTGNKIKDAFVDTLKGKPVAKDKFGTIIGVGDYICWGTGSQSAADLNFGKVIKINYSVQKFGEGRCKEKVSSITTMPIERVNSWRNKNADDAKVVKGFVKGTRKRPVSSFGSSWVLDNPPEILVELLKDA